MVMDLKKRIVLILLAVALGAGVWLVWFRIRGRIAQRRIGQLSGALHAGDIQMMRRLLQKDRALASSRNAYGRPIFFFATTLDGARLILETGADVNAADEVGQNVLHALAGVDRGNDAANRRKPELARYYLEHGADPSKRDKYGATPLHYCGKYKDARMAEFFLAHGMDPNAADLEGKTPLHYASYWRGIEVADLLIRHGADVNARTQSTVTPLHSAALNANLEGVKMLLQNGADPNAKNDKGEIPSDYARKVSGGEAVRRILIAAEHSEDSSGSMEEGPRTEP